MTTVSKLGIKCPADSEGYFVCRLSHIGKYRRNGTTLEEVPYSSDRRRESGVSE